MLEQDERVRIFDTTLRDGEQSPGATLNADEKLEIARQLARLGVDIIEAGFPIASPDDFSAVQRIAQTVEGPVICGLARAVAEDVDRAWLAVQPSAKPRIHVFMSTSDIHLTHQFRTTRQLALESTKKMVARARGYCADIEFSPMDATRTERAYLFEVLEAAIETGATTLNIPDTVGYSTPHEYGALIADILAHVRGVEKTIISVHCHDDLGMAVANSLAGVAAGARQIECTINGIGERAGNAALEEVVMALRTRPDSYGPLTKIDTAEIYRTSRLVSARTGVLVQPNKAVVGANAFAHEAGIHQDGVLKERSTYEILDARDIGLATNRLVLGKHSGRHAIKARLAALGYDLSSEDLGRVFLRFKELADKKKEIGDLDLEALAADEVRSGPAALRLDGLQVTCGDPGIPTAAVRLLDAEGTLHVVAAVGTGPVDAAFKAIDEIVAPLLPVPDARPHLVEYAVQAVTAGIDAIGEVHVRVEAGSRIFIGRSGATDIVVASVRAYLDALNRVIDAGDSVQVGRVTAQDMARV